MTTVSSIPGGPASGVPAEVLERARRWRTQDPDPVTAAALDELLAGAEAGDPVAGTELVAAFAGRLEFGTAGLRGPLGPGPARMNRVVVSQTAAGLGAYLRASGLVGTVLVGYDARHRSDAFARDTAEILTAAGFEVLLTDRPVPTPLVAYGIRHLGCVAGVVVTASHNPPEDNGYKVYLGDGSQIVPPADSEIAACIDRAAEEQLDALPRSTAYRTIGDELFDAYRRRMTELLPAGEPRAVRWVYTPMHGVGRELAEMVVTATEFPAPLVVAEQADPDPDFPTVNFPNPEEPGALELALELARGRDADLVIANDPDADRCAVAISIGGSWRVLHGDELGALLAEDFCRRGVRGVYANSVVSGSLLGRIAAAYDQPHAVTLTGFKWIGRVPGLAYGYEEAIGYCCDPDAVADKDGISTLLAVLRMAAELKAEGRTLADALDDLARTYGVHHNGQLAIRVDDLGLITGAMARLRANPPRELCGEPVTVTDLNDGWEALQPTDAVRLTGRQVTVTVRPSGTEPKLKCYLEARLPREDSDDLTTAREHARGLADRAAAEVRAALGI